MSSNPLLAISPPLINSSNPWATTPEDLLQLYNCSSTGAVTTRTSLLQGFTQHPTTHQYTFFSPSLGHATSKINTSGLEGRGEVLPDETSSLNTLGYSPIPFHEYITTIVQFAQDGLLDRKTIKPFIVSVTGTKEDVADMYTYLIRVQDDADKMIPPSGEGKNASGLKLMMEVNLSCPNIPDKPPPAYDGVSLTEYITTISAVQNLLGKPPSFVPVGIKTPPYTYSLQFQTLISSLENVITNQETSRSSTSHPISFITSTNTLGNCFVPSSTSTSQPALGSINGSGIGGLGGTTIHALSLGNVRTIRTLLDESRCEELRRIKIIGVGGVSDASGFERMRAVGADVVGVGTTLGRGGVNVFKDILSGVNE